MVTKYIVAYAVIATAAALLAGWLFIGAREDLAAERIARQADINRLTAEVRGLEGERDDLTRDIAFRQMQIDTLTRENAKIITDRDKELARYDRFRASIARRTLAKPEVTRRAARRDISSRMRRLCTLTGGDAAQCRTPRPPGTTLAAPRPAGGAGTDRRDPGADTPVEPPDR